MKVSMKNIALLSLLALVGCGGDNQTSGPAPAPVAPPVVAPPVPGVSNPVTAATISEVRSQFESMPLDSGISNGMEVHFSTVQQQNDVSLLGGFLTLQGNFSFNVTNSPYLGTNNILHIEKDSGSSYLVNGERYEERDRQEMLNMALVPRQVNGSTATRENVQPITVSLQEASVLGTFNTQQSCYLVEHIYDMYGGSAVDAYVMCPGLPLIANPVTVMQYSMINGQAQPGGVRYSDLTGITTQVTTPTGPGLLYQSVVGQAAP